MADIKPFRCVRPREDLASRVAALPYDVYNRAEAKVEVEREPLSFLAIDRAETSLPDEVDTYDPAVYAHAKELYQERLSDGTFVRDEDSAYYVYELVMDGRSQVGLVAVASIDDYVSGVIKKHENTREDKEIDRITHVDTLGAQTGPIFLAYRSDAAIDAVVSKARKGTPLYDFTATDGITHRVWKISDATDVEEIEAAFRRIKAIYIADGHHRAASAVKVGLKRREQASGGVLRMGDEETLKKNESTEVESDYFLSVLFPHEQLKILDYNRTVKDLNGLSVEGFFSKVRESFIVKAMNEPIYPDKKGCFGMYLDGKWYHLMAREELYKGRDAVGSLDVSILQDYLLGPILGIGDPRTDKRIDFIGGIRGLAELERRANEDMRVSFSMYPTSITELFDVADAGLLMPPKSTWFEPKLRSGLFIHEI
ncbi:MAG: DUF1015 domain-containing protein [Eubacterium sp.]|nr:DUF1015 domain-containing protein [Eubacterium sp.]